MRGHQEDTPPSSVDGDNVMSMDGLNDDEVIYLGEVDDIDFGDEEMDEEPVEDHAEIVFNEHAGSVFCCDLHPSGKIAATGAEDDKAIVWSAETGQVIVKLSGHKDSVIFVGFSFDGAYLSTVDMGGIIKVWKCSEDKQWPLAFEYEADDLIWGLCHFGARVLICGAAAGNIYVFKIPSGDTKVLQGHNIKTECGKLFPDGIRLAAGYEDGIVKIWDLKSNSVLHQLPNGMHDLNIRAVDVHPENKLLASISADGKICLTTTNNGKVVAQLESEIECEAVAFCPDAQLDYFALGTLSGSTSIWDTARQMVRHWCAKSEEGVATGVTKMIWIKDNLVTGCLDGSVRSYEARSGTRNAMLTGHQSEILDLVYNAKENVILTTSEDGTARIFKYPVKCDND